MGGTSDFLDLEDGKLEVLVFVFLGVKRAAKDLPLCFAVVYRNLGDVSGTALDVGPWICVSPQTVTAYN